MHARAALERFPIIVAESSERERQAGGLIAGTIWLIMSDDYDACVCVLGRGYGRVSDDGLRRAGYARRCITGVLMCALF